MKLSNDQQLFAVPESWIASQPLSYRIQQFIGGPVDLAINHFMFFNEESQIALVEIEYYSLSDHRVVGADAYQ